MAQVENGILLHRAKDDDSSIAALQQKGIEGSLNFGKRKLQST